jgi:hypothetical protein
MPDQKKFEDFMNYKFAKWGLILVINVHVCMILTIILTMMFNVR